jgi:hypothetical protein
VLADRRLLAFSSTADFLTPAQLHYIPSQNALFLQSAQEAPPDLLPALAPATAAALQSTSAAALPPRTSQQVEQQLLEAMITLPQSPQEQQNLSLSQLQELFARNYGSSPVPSDSEDPPIVPSGIRAATASCGPIGNGGSSTWQTASETPAQPVKSDEAEASAGGVQCTFCRALYENEKGMRVHCAKMHREEYVALLAETYKEPTYRLWTPEQELQMATMELALPPHLKVKEINDELARVMGRNSKAIKLRRLMPVYRQLKQQLAELSSSQSSSSQTDPTVGVTLHAAQPPADFPALAPAAQSQAASPTDLPAGVTFEAAQPLADLTAFAPAAQSQAAMSTPLNISRNITMVAQIDTSAELNEVLHEALVQLPLELRGEAMQCTSNQQLIACLLAHIQKVAQQSTRPRREQLPKQQKHRPATRAQRRRVKFRETQRLYYKDKRRLAAQLFDPQPDSQLPPQQEVADLFTSLFNSESPADTAPFQPVDVQPRTLLQPIESGDVAKAVRSLSFRSATGNDRISNSVLKKVRTTVLTALFNALLIEGDIPSTWKSARTVLIPKAGCDTSRATNWRPITVTPCLYRLFTKLLNAKMLRDVSLTWNQRAFLPTDGTFENALIMRACLHKAHNSLSPLYAAILDVSKAFDSVSHASINRALRRFNYDAGSCALIEHIYTSCTTTLHLDGKEIGNTSVRRGVKQGCPLSPTLFNLVLDEMQACLPAESGVRFGSMNLNHIMFADDIILLAKNAAELQQLLDTANNFLQQRGLNLNAAKCSTLAIRRETYVGSMYISTAEDFSIDGQPLKKLRENDTLKYMGVFLDSHGRADVSNIDINSMLTALKRSALRVNQRIDMLRLCLLPRLLHQLAISLPTINQLQQYDYQVRDYLHKALYCSKISNGFLHSPISAGGLGIMELSVAIPTIFLKRLQKVKVRAEAGDPILQQLLKSKWLITAEARTRRYLEEGGIPAATTEAVATHHVNQWRSCVVQGSGAAEFATPTSNWWMHRGTHQLQGRAFIKAIQMRVEMLPTREKAARGTQVGNKRCRGCRLGRVETQSHILSACTGTFTQRVNRHNRVIEVMNKMLRERGHKTWAEPHILTDTERLKPDFVVRTAETAHVIDVACTYQDLPAAAAAKVNKYRNISPRIKALTGATTVKYYGLVISPRGAWCPSNINLLHQLGLPLKSTQKKLIEAVIMASVHMHTAFMRAY